VTAGTDAGPGRQVIIAQEYAHVDADTRNLHQERVLRAVGLEPLADAQVERCDVCLDRFEPAQLHRQEEAVMLLDPPVERQGKLGAFAAQLALGEVGHRLG